jgi:chromosome segregation ATPase
VVVRVISVVPAPPAARAPAATPSPAGFPKVDPATQKARDGARRRILEEELVSEEKALVDAKAELKEQEGIRTGDEKNFQRVLDRLQKYKDEVERHENNITALKKELGNIK